RSTTGEEDGSIGRLRIMPMPPVDRSRISSGMMTLPRLSTRWPHKEGLGLYRAESRRSAPPPGPGAPDEGFVGSAMMGPRAFPALKRRDPADRVGRGPFRGLGLRSGQPLGVRAATGRALSGTVSRRERFPKSDGGIVGTLFLHCVAGHTAHDPLTSWPSE